MGVLEDGPRRWRLVRALGRAHVPRLEQPGLLPQRRRSPGQRAGAGVVGHHGGVVSAARRRHADLGAAGGTHQSRVAAGDSEHPRRRVGLARPAHRRQLDGPGHAAGGSPLPSRPEPQPGLAAPPALHPDDGPGRPEVRHLCRQPLDRLHDPGRGPEPVHRRTRLRSVPRSRRSLRHARARCSAVTRRSCCGCSRGATCSC